MNISFSGHLVTDKTGLEKNRAQHLEVIESLAYGSLGFAVIRSLVGATNDYDWQRR
jgi:hypothetical protein